MDLFPVLMTCSLNLLLLVSACCAPPSCALFLASLPTLLPPCAPAVAAVAPRWMPTRVELVEAGRQDLVDLIQVHGGAILLLLCYCGAGGSTGDCMGCGREGGRPKGAPYAGSTRWLLQKLELLQSMVGYSLCAWSLNTRFPATLCCTRTWAASPKQRCCWVYAAGGGPLGTGSSWSCWGRSWRPLCGAPGWPCPTLRPRGSCITTTWCGRGVMSHMFLVYSNLSLVLPGGETLCVPAPRRTTLSAYRFGCLACLVLYTWASLCEWV